MIPKKKLSEKSLTEIILDCVTIDERLETARVHGEMELSYAQLRQIVSPTYLSRVVEMEDRGYDVIAGRYRRKMEKW